MIQLEHDRGLFADCPWCRRQPVRYHDGDNLQLRAALKPEWRSPNGFYATYHFGSCEFCGGQFFGCTLNMIAGSIDEDQQTGGLWNYLWLNEDTELLGSHEAVLDAMRWPVTLHATPKGTMFQHDFGPYAMRDQAWEFMQQIIIGIWPALRALAELSNGGIP